MRYYPLFVDTKQRAFALIGGGAEALCKYRLIKRTEATIEVFADRIEMDFQQALDEDATIVRPLSEFSYTKAYGAVFIAIDDEVVIDSVYRSCLKQHIPVNVVDDPQRCTFITPAIVDRDPLVIAIGTEGIAPVLARHLKSELESRLPEKTGALLRFLSSKRSVLMRELKDGRARRQFWQKLMPLEEPLWLAREPMGQWKEQFRRLLTRTGRIRLVGRLTEIEESAVENYNQRQRGLMQSTDVVLLVGEVGQVTVDLARRDAQFISILAENAYDCATALNKKGLDVVIIRSSSSIIAATTLLETA